MAKKKMRSMLTQQREKLKAQKAAKAAKQAKTPRLPPGKKGGPIVKAKPSTPASPRRGAATRKTRAAAKGTKGTTTRVAGGRGLPKQTPKLPPASASRTAARATAKAVKPMTPLLKGVGRVAGPAALAISGISTAQDLAASLKRGEGIVRLAKGIGPKKKRVKNAKTNRRGRTVNNTKGNRNKPPTKPTKRGMSNIPPGEGTGKGSPNDKKKPATPKTKPPVSKPPVKKPTSQKPPASKPPAKKSSASTYKKHGSDLHIGRHKTLAEHRKAVADRKKKKPNQSAANRAGYPGNRNY